MPHPLTGCTFAQPDSALAISIRGFRSVVRGLRVFSRIVREREEFALPAVSRERPLTKVPEWDWYAPRGTNQIDRELNCWSGKGDTRENRSHLFQLEEEPGLREGSGYLMAG